MTSKYRIVKNYDRYAVQKKGLFNWKYYGQYYGLYYFEINWYDTLKEAEEFVKELLEDNELEYNRNKAGLKVIQKYGT